MSNVIVPKTRILTGPGVLYKAILGSLLPGQKTAAVTNKALTSNVATLTFTSHTFIVGDIITVALSPADASFDGANKVVTAITAITITYAQTATNVTSAASTGTVTSVPGGIVVASAFSDAWPAAWVPVGVTKQGSQYSWNPATGNIDVAEYLLPVRIVTTGVEAKVQFEMAEFTAKNTGFALNGGPVTTVSGTGTTLLTKVSPPVVGQEIRTMIGWESDDSTQRRIYYQCLQTGTLTVQHHKGTDNASLPVEFSMEQPATGNAFDEWYAGSLVVGV
jgi:hypothetical protein